MSSKSNERRSCVYLGGKHPPQLTMTVKSSVAITLLSSICLLACGPSAFVAISNETNTDKRIKAIYPPKFILPGEVEGPLSSGKPDSIETYNLASEDIYKGKKFIPITSRDTVTRTYSFVLKANQRALIEARSFKGAPTYKQIFIIDDTDTVKLVRRGKAFEKRPKLMWGGTWEYYITDGQPPRRQAYYTPPVKREEPDTVDYILDILDIVVEAITNTPKRY